MSLVTTLENPERQIKSQGNCVHSAFVCQFYTVSNPQTTLFLTIRCRVWSYVVVLLQRAPSSELVAAFTISVSESWKQSTSMSAWKHNTGAEQSIDVYCLGDSVSQFVPAQQAGWPPGIARCRTCHLDGGKLTHTCWHRCWRKYTDAQSLYTHGMCAPVVQWLTQEYNYPKLPRQNLFAIEQIIFFRQLADNLYKLLIVS